MALTLGDFQKNYSSLKGKPTAVYHQAILKLKKLKIGEPKVFYPKNIFTNELLEMFLFNDSSLTHVSIDEKRNMFWISNYNYQEIKSIVLELDYQKSDRQTLKVEVPNNVFYFNNEQDTNENHLEEFYRKIDNIYSLITTRKLLEETSSNVDATDDIVYY
ncbi:hypothetical protein [Halobacillus sp. Marseille-P3879]|uniref:hypothetical protein n=1 Tax=Halobacillus sp. Marseille-P3879 TaxID=2045014 RepID=UPI000C7D4990|nr:hypothetical protein [Halobacillus sp. Marseille-P3879]